MNIHTATLRDEHAKTQHIAYPRSNSLNMWVLGKTSDLADRDYERVFSGSSGSPGNDSSLNCEAQCSAHCALSTFVSEIGGKGKKGSCEAPTRGRYGRASRHARPS